MMIARNGAIIAANSLMQTLLGYAPDELLSKSADDLSPPEARTDYAEWREKFFQVESTEERARTDNMRQIRAVAKDGRELKLDIRLKHLDSEETGPCVIASLREATPSTDQAAVSETARKQDRFTDLPDKNHFLESVHAAVTNAEAEGRFVSVLTVNSGEHGKIVDTLGREAGDEYLREMAARISRIRRKQDTVARLAGDEFAVMIDSLGDPDLMNKLAVRIQSFLSAPVYIGEHSFAPRPSIGVSVFPTDALDAAALLRNADLAMHDAKRSGRGGICFFSDDMGERAKQRLTLESDLRSAMFKDEFVVHFQPIFELQARSLSGIESFLRWQHPKLGTIELRDFMQIAEETGMAAPLGETALWLTFEAIRKLKAMGHWPLRVLHSLSTRQLARADSLLRQLRGLLLDSKIDPQHVQFAIHETDMPLADEQITTLLEISEMGFRICVDEFGTGASALTYLVDMPVHSIKLAPGLISEAIEDEHTQSVLSATVQMARSLGIEVIATDIESNAHLETARVIAFDSSQGDWQCPSLDFDKLCKAVFTGARTGLAAPASTPAGAEALSMSNIRG